MDGRFVAGVDSVPTKNGGGWVMALTGVNDAAPVGFLTWPTFEALWSYACQSNLVVVAVDMPVGLPSEGYRAADRVAKKDLESAGEGTRGRTPSVFDAPPPFTLDIEDYAKANALSKSRAERGLMAQAYALRHKIKEVRRLQPCDFYDSAAPRAAEVHPEVSFKWLARRPMAFAKSCQAGTTERLKALEGAFPDIVERAVLTSIPLTPEPDEPRPGLDDVLDAAAAAWTARRLAMRRAEPLGGRRTDDEGYPMTIWV